MEPEKISKTLKKNKYVSSASKIMLAMEIVIDLLNSHKIIHYF